MGVGNEQLTPEAECVLREIHDHCREPGIIDVTYWSKVFQEKSGAYISRLRKLLKELKDNDFLQIRWAENMPYTMDLTSKGLQYFEIKNAQSQENNKTKFIDKPWKLFISHADVDKQYVDALVDLLNFLGFSHEQIFCSSRPGYDIPVDTEDFFIYLKDLFNGYRLHVIILHSKGYYNSPVCLNEMGAAWVLDCKISSLLVPGFDFDNMRGVVHNRGIATKLDHSNREVRDKLNQLKDTLVQEFGLGSKPIVDWEDRRNEFIEKVNSIVSVDPSSLNGSENSNDDIDTDDQGLLFKKSERASGKNIVYCPTCYTDTGKLYQILPGSMPRDRFCTKCKTRFK